MFDLFVDICMLPVALITWVKDLFVWAQGNDLLPQFAMTAGVFVGLGIFTLVFSLFRKRRKRI